MAKVNYLRARNESLPTGGNRPVAGFTIPVTRGLRAAYLFSGGIGLALQNYATGGEQGAIVGSPVEIDRYLHLGPSTYIDSGLSENDIVSALVIGKRHGANAPAFIGSSNLGDGGFGLYVPGGSAIFRVSTTAGNVDTTVVTNANEWRAYAMVAPQTGGGYQVHNLTEGTSKTSVSTDNRANSGNDPIIIGSLIQTPSTWDADMLLALWSDVVWTPEEIEQLYAWAKSYAADFGIVV